MKASKPLSTVLYDRVTTDDAVPQEQEKTTRELEDELAQLQEEAYRRELQKQIDKLRRGW